MIADKIRTFLDSNQKITDESILQKLSALTAHNFRRQFMEDRQKKAGVIRPSSIGKCVRQQAYAFHGIEEAGKEIDWRARVNFWLGDNIEAAVIYLAVCSGCDLRGIGLDQMKVSYKVGDYTVNGSPDGMIYEDGKPVALLSVKSMTDYSFSDLEKGSVEPSYIAQENDYLSSDEITALGITRSCLVAINKVSGAISETFITKSRDVVSGNRARAEAILKSTPDNLPMGEFGPDEKGFFPWQCLYCAYHEKCKPEAKKILVKGRYKLAI